MCDSEYVPHMLSMSVSVDAVNLYTLTYRVCVDVHIYVCKNLSACMNSSFHIMCIDILPAHLSALSGCSPRRGQKKTSDSLGLELQIRSCDCWE